MNPKENPQNPGTILLTGGSGGLGRALVSLLSDLNYKILNWDVLPPKSILPNETYYKIDLTSVSELDKACGMLKAEFLSGPSPKESPLNGFVHSAGYGGPYHKITEVSLDEWERIFAINLRSAFQITKSLLPVFAERKYGRLVYIASSLSVQGSALSVAYSSSKHGIVGFAKSIGAEWGENGITANAISPGYMETTMGIQEDQVNDHRKKIIDMTPVKKIADPSEIARVVAFLLSPESGYINSANWTVDGGITSI
ncbi:SDR family oxidoreductase [Leptospira langatensis]|uniref:SDR family oxidoreductase n=1 Tax=Leptospira langatensis TaxID=2484983 RepID=A0A5F1ZQP1_9LEPT|nr:SDR family oxidoreductase [Leptospira langatensis]TGK01918.1 SDR family oxidoreductase [Leptospira langatensis]TGL39522.1 SDR family oxidoreductase [Leptospira langatensis]